MPLSNANIQIVANCLITWEELARHLELTDAEEEEIRHDHVDSYKEQKYQCIKYWAKKNGKKATLDNLLRHIYFNLEDKHLVFTIVQTLQNANRLVGKQTYITI